MTLDRAECLLLANCVRVYPGSYVRSLDRGFPVPFGRCAGAERGSCLAIRRCDYRVQKEGLGTSSPFSVQVSVFRLASARQLSESLRLRGLAACIHALATLHVHELTPPGADFSLIVVNVMLPRPVAADAALNANARAATNMIIFDVIGLSPD